MTAGSYDPTGFYDIARALLAHADDQGYLRTSISRAYYACFHLALAGCRRKWSWAPPDYGQHRAVTRKLREQRLTVLSRQLQMLLDLRERADYDLDTPIDEPTCRTAIELAGWLVPRLRSI